MSTANTTPLADETIKQSVVPNSTKVKPIPWEQSTIKEIEKFFVARLGLSPLLIRLIAASMTSVACKSSVSVNRLGKVNPNIWVLYLARSGIGMKTPLIQKIRELMREYNKEFVAPSQFSSAGFVEHVNGTRGKKNSDGDVEREKIERHLINIIIKDEASKLLGNIANSPYASDMLEFLSELWDCEVEGKHTKRWQFEGGVQPFVSFIGVGSERFYKLLDEDFFIQGLGNRLYWNTEQCASPQKVGLDFFCEESEDKEWEELKAKTIDKFKIIEKFEGVFFTHSARQVYIDFKYECDKYAYNHASIKASYVKKESFNLLKLSIVYAASRLNFGIDNTLTVDKEDIDRALEDITACDEQYDRAIARWRELKKDSKFDDRVKNLKWDLANFAKVAIELGGLFSNKTMRIALKVTDKEKVYNVIDLGVDAKVFEIAFNDCTYVDGKVMCINKLTPEEFKKWKPATGTIGSIFRITDEGRKLAESSE